MIDWLFDDYYPEQVLAMLIAGCCLANLSLVFFIWYASRKWTSRSRRIIDHSQHAIHEDGPVFPYQRIAASIRRILGTDGRQRLTWRRRTRIALRVWGRCQYHHDNCLGQVWPWSKGDPDGNGKYSHLGHADHVVPVAGGGRNFGNLVWSCYRCNLEKGTDVEGWDPDPLTFWQRIIDIVLIVVLADLPSIRDF